MIQKLQPQFGNAPGIQALASQTKIAQDTLINTAHIASTAPSDGLGKLGLQSQDQWSPISVEKHSGLTATAAKPVEEIEASKVSNLKIPYSFEVISLAKTKSPFNNTISAETAEELKPTLAYKKLQSAKSVAIGDLHASSQKLFETLVVGGFIQMPEPKLKQLQHSLAMIEITGNEIDRKVSAPAALTRLSPDPLKIEQNALKHYHQEVLELLPQMKWAGGKKQLILIGDVIADRGAYDPTTLAIIARLDQQAPGQIIRLASNHDHNSLKYITDNQLDYPWQSQSIRNAVRIARQGYAGEDKLKASYLQHLKQSQVFHWDPDSKTIYSHAPITRSTLDNAIEKLNGTGLNLTDYSDLNEKNLPHFVQTINQAYKDHVVEMADTVPAHRNFQLKEREKAFHKILWCRSPLSKESQLPFNEKTHGVKVLAHGHDPKSLKSPFAIGQSSSDKPLPVAIVNLDNAVRKQGYIEGNSPLFMIEN
jgi:hypothetical protein